MKKERSHRSAGLLGEVEESLWIFTTSFLLSVPLNTQLVCSLF